MEIDPCLKDYLSYYTKYNFYIIKESIIILYLSYTHTYSGIYAWAQDHLNNNYEYIDPFFWKSYYFIIKKTLSYDYYCYTNYIDYLNHFKVAQLS